MLRSQPMRDVYTQTDNTADVANVTLRDTPRPAGQSRRPPTLRNIASCHHGAAAATTLNATHRYAVIASVTPNILLRQRHCHTPPLIRHRQPRNRPRYAAITDVDMPCYIPLRVESFTVTSTPLRPR